jgi:hypothetical protein
MTEVMFDLTTPGGDAKPLSRITEELFVSFSGFL